MKSTLCMDAGLHIAAGSDWMRLKTKRASVFYLATEKTETNRHRIQAYKQLKPDLFNMAVPVQSEEQNFFLIEERINFMLKDDMELFSDFWGDKLKGSLIIVDTLRKAIGTSKENDAEVATVCIQNAEYLHENFGCTTWFQHHPGKDIARGARGSHAWHTDIDTEFTISKIDMDTETGLPTACLENTNQKGSVQGEDIFYSIELSHIADDPETGDPFYGSIAKQTERVLAPVQQDIYHYVRTCSSSGYTATEVANHFKKDLSQTVKILKKLCEYKILGYDKKNNHYFAINPNL